MQKSNVNRKFIICADIVLLIIAVACYSFLYNKEVSKARYAYESEKVIEENENPIFKLGKVVIYNGANAVDNSEGELKDIDISHFSDFEIYIENSSENELTPENTIRELFIDNIKIEYNDESNGEKIFNYKNPQKCGKYVELSNWQDDGILFNVIKTNEKNKKANYDENIFYTDCSNPISLGYVNKNILKGCEVNNTEGVIAFDGSILESAGIDLKTLGAKFSFTIHIINNYNDEYVCNVELDNEVKEDIYAGYKITMLDMEKENVVFVKTGTRK